MAVMQINRVRRRASQLADYIEIAARRLIQSPKTFPIPNTALSPVSVITVSFNSVMWTKLMLLTLAETIGADIKTVVVVDNGSNDGSWEFLSQLSARRSKVIAIRNRTHRNHGGGYEQV